MDNCCDSLLNKLLCIFNFFFLLTGIALISMGVYVHVEMKNYLNYLDDTYLNASILFIVLGAAILILGFFGCCGACTESACMMFTFGSLLSIVVIIEIGCAITIYLFRTEAHTIIAGKMTEGLINYDNGEEFKGVTDTWNAVQSDFVCCGVSNYTNWAETPYGQKTHGAPDSCCKHSEPDCGLGIFNGSKTIEEINQDGCFSKLEQFVVDNVAIVLGVGAGIAVLQIIGVLVSCMLAGSMRRRANYV